MVEPYFRIIVSQKVPLSLRKYLPSMCEVILFSPITRTSMASSVFISSFAVPAGSPGVACMIEMTADGKPTIQKKEMELSHASQVGMHISSFKH